MEIPGLGALTPDPGHDGYRSDPMPVPGLGGAVCAVVFPDCDGGPVAEDLLAAAVAFLALDASVLRAAAGPIFEYYEDVVSVLGEDLPDRVAGPAEVLAHIRPGREALVERDGDEVYVSVECECSWEPEHGLQLVFLGGRTVSKVGPYDGHLTHHPRFPGENVAGVVYQRML
ncbi:DUF6985 domain-containing protein [Kitasatospora sp. NPDC051853]|uniref:DUF6985 domain-containing protein n=1 Tax=Kitasatospora sp. NPDC051853 TaxID=3364058 RepID=UPI0037B506F6